MEENRRLGPGSRENPKQVRPREVYTKKHCNQNVNQRQILKAAKENKGII